MIVYLVMYFLSIAIAYSSKLLKDDKKRKMIFILSAVPFIIVSAIRYDVGTDYMSRYFSNYLTIANGGKIENLEMLFYILVKICTFLSSEPYILFATTSIIIYLLFFKSIKDESKGWILSITIFFIAGFFFQSMNLVRQYVAMAIVMYAHKFLFNKSGKKYIWYICIIIASLIHSISFIYLFLVLLKKKKINILWIITIMIIIALIGNVIVKYGFDIFRRSDISNIQKYAIYFRQKGDFSWSMFISEFCIYIFLYIFNRKNNDDTKKNLYTNVQGIGVLFILISAKIELFSRLAGLFVMFQTISIPYFMNTEDDIFLKLEDKKISLKKIFLYMIIILYIVRFIYSVIFNGAYGVLPYRTIFEMR